MGPIGDTRPYPWSTQVINPNEAKVKLHNPSTLKIRVETENDGRRRAVGNLKVFSEATEKQKFQGTRPGVLHRGVLVPSNKTKEIGTSEAGLCKNHKYMV